MLFDSVPERGILEDAAGEGQGSRVGTRLGRRRDDDDVHVKVLVPIRVQCLLDDGSRISLFSIDSDDSERVWKTMFVRQTSTGWMTEGETTSFRQHCRTRAIH